MLSWIAENSVVTLGLCAVALVACRLVRLRPAVCHLIWVLVLLRLVAPPLPVPSCGPQELIRDQVQVLAERCESLIPRQIPTKDCAPWEEAAELRAGHSRGLPVHSGEKNKRREKKKAWKVAERADSEFASVTEDRVAADAPPFFGAASEPPLAAFAVAETALPDAAESPFWTLERIKFAFVFTWLVGALFALFAHLRRTRRVERLVATARPAPLALRRLCERVAAELGVAVPEIRVLDGLQSPFVWGAGRPILVWPGRDTDYVEPRSMRGVLAHELAHIRRRDHWLGWLEVAATSFLWWNPLVWFVRNRIRLYAELSCDAWAVSVCPTERRAYAEALIDVAESVSGAFALGHAENKPHNFERRLRMVMRETVSCRVQPLLALAAIAAVVAIYPTTSAAQGRTARTWSASDPAIVAALRRADLTRRGDAFYESSEWDQAVRMYRALLELEPENGKAWHRLGYCLLPLGKHTEAANAFARQLESGFEPANAAYNIACTHALRGNTDSALEHLERAVRLGFTKTSHISDDSDLSSLREDERFDEILALAKRISRLVENGNKLFERYDWKQTSRVYRELVKLTPDDGRAWHRLGYSYIVDGRYAASVEPFRRQLALGHRKATALYNLACAHARLGERKAGLNWLAKAVDAGFDRHKLLRTDDDLGALREEPGFQRLRKRVLQRAMARATAKSLQEVADWETAARYFRRMLEDKPDSASLWRSLAQVQAQLGEYAAAERSLKESMQRGEVTDAMVELASVHLKAGESAKALACLHDAVRVGYRNGNRLENEDFFQLRGRGLQKVLDRLGDAKVLDGWDAIDWRHLGAKARRKIEEKPRNGSAYLMLGWSLLRQERFDEAIAAFRKQHDLGCSRKIALYNVACCYAKKGNADAAFDWLDRAVESGWRDVDHVIADPDLENLRAGGRLDAFVEKLGRMRKHKDKGKSAWRKAHSKKKP